MFYSGFISLLNFTLIFSTTEVKKMTTTSILHSEPLKYDDVAQVYILNLRYFVLNNLILLINIASSQGFI